MASTSTSSVQKSFKYDVFLSFRGEDTRKTFVDHLYHALHQKGIETFKDDEKIDKGERISDQLIRSIEESRFYIIVFSKNYASSSWCLDELVKIMECQKTMEQTAYPVFYDVEPTEVRNQSGAVGEAFAKHEKGSWSSVLPLDRLCSLNCFMENEDDAGRWRNALQEAAGLAGMELKNNFNGHEAKFIQKIVEDISLKLNFINYHFDEKLVDEKLVGMQTRVKNIVSFLKTGPDDVRMIGIKGIGGGGKTTLARTIFYHISSWFEGKSFLENVREVSNGSSTGLKKLQKQVLKDVLNDQSIVVTSVSNGKNVMEKMMRGRKVLVVLDDVDDIEQLEALAGELCWFKPGSRIIITTRDEQVLRAHGVTFIHDVNLLSNDEAIWLFNKYAFRGEIPIQGYEQLSRMVVHYAAGLPLTIKVLGSHLCGRSECEWIDAIERLKTIPLEKTLKRLELSYNGLENDQKEIFLDVVCMLKGEKKDHAIRILESCGFNAQIGLKILEQKSLITISDKDCLGFHDHIGEMGRNIVRRLHPNEPSRHSRLWLKEEIEDILVNESATEATRSIKLLYSDLHPEIIMKGLRKMKELRFLYVRNKFSGWEVDEGSQYLPDALRTLCWHWYPFRSLPRTFGANKLVNLEMRWSNISQLWEVGERKVLDKLKYLDLRESKLSNLNLGMTPHLKELNLEGCSYLQEIHVPVGCLKNLVYLNLSGCSTFGDFLVNKWNVLPGLHSLSKLELFAQSRDICPLHPNNNLPNFKFVCLYDESLPSSSENIEKLLSFGLCTCTNLVAFWASICGIQHLRELTLKGSIPEVPKDLDQIKNLERLSFLRLEEIKHLPNSICMLRHLKSLELKSCCLLEQLPNDLDRLESLEVLDLMGCTSLRYIPNNICKMKCLKYLNLCLCILVEKLPEELGRLECLKGLKIDGTGIRCLPQSIYQLKGLNIYWSTGQLESYGFTSLTETSTHTYGKL